MRINEHNEQAQQAVSFSYMSMVSSSLDGDAWGGCKQIGEGLGLKQLQVGDAPTYHIKIKAGMRVNEQAQQAVFFLYTYVYSVSSSWDGDAWGGCKQIGEGLGLD